MDKPKGTKSPNEFKGHSTSAVPRQPRTLVLCFDGTANKFDNENSNVAKFFSLLKKDVDDQQVVYYQPGPGTYFNPGAVSPFARRAAKALDLAIAWYLHGHVKDGYRFLMQNYHGGDRICLFGFSRGAYVARALAGFLTKCGLLPKDNREQLHFAYELYVREDMAGIALAARFKGDFTRSVTVEFVGVWDTVASVGILRTLTLPFTDTNRDIKTFRHALSLDERRAMFQPNLWHRPSPSLLTSQSEGWKLAQAPVSAAEIETRSMQRTEIHLPHSEAPLQNEQIANSLHGNQQSLAPSVTTGSSESTTSALHTPRLSILIRKHPNEMGRRKRKLTMGAVVKAAVAADQETSTSFEDQERPPLPATDVLEVYFCGSHSDVGGGSVSNATQRSVSQIPLRWMVRQVKLANCGIIFDKHVMRRLKIPTDHPQSTEYTSSWEKELDLEDIKAPVFDRLDRAGRRLPSVWWLTEFLPSQFQWQTEDGDWRKEWKVNVGDGRRIRQPSSLPLLFHFTVRERMQTGYLPKATWDPKIEPRYVE